MRRVYGGVTALCLLLTVPATAGADTQLELNARLGAAVTVSSYDFVSSGAYLSVAALARLVPAVALGLEVGGNVGHKIDSPFFGDISVEIIQVTPVVRLQQAFSDAVMGYLALGFGYYRTDYDFTTYNNLGFNGGFGLLFAVTPNVSAGVDVRYHQAMEEGVNPQYVTPALLVTFTP